MLHSPATHTHTHTHRLDSAACIAHPDNTHPNNTHPIAHTPTIHTQAGQRCLHSPPRSRCCGLCVHAVWHLCLPGHRAYHTGELEESVTLGYCGLSCMSGICISLGNILFFPTSSYNILLRSMRATQLSMNATQLSHYAPQFSKGDACMLRGATYMFPCLTSSYVMVCSSFSLLQTRLPSSACLKM